MFEQDYILRLIEEYIAVMMKMIFGREMKTAEAEAAASEQSGDGSENPIYKRVDSGNIREAESMLYNSMKTRTADNLLKGYSFYQYVAQKDEAFLEAHGYSRSMLTDGLRRLASLFGAPHIADIFFPV